MNLIAFVVLFTIFAQTSLNGQDFNDQKDLETSESIAIGHLSQSDKELYLEQKPLGVLRNRFKVSSFSNDESTAKLFAVQRSAVAKVTGWRMVLIGSSSLLVFHVSDDGKEQLLLRSELKDAILNQKPPDGNEGTEQGVAPNRSLPPSQDSTSPVRGSED